MREYFNRNVRMVWIVDPEDRTVTVYRSLDEGRVLHRGRLYRQVAAMPAAVAGSPFHEPSGASCPSFTSQPNTRPPSASTA